MLIGAVALSSMLLPVPNVAERSLKALKIKVFGKKGCAKCDTTKNKFNHFLQKNNLQSVVNLEFFDMDTIDGRAEGAYYDVLKIPVTVFEKEGSVLARWDGEVPVTEDFRGHIGELSTSI